MLAGELEPGDPEPAACSVNLAYISHRFNTYLGN
jgi:hypothetical protein